MWRHVLPVFHLLRVLSIPWRVAVLLLVLAAVTVWWHRTRDDAALRGQPYGRVVPYAERAEPELGDGRTGPNA